MWKKWDGSTRTIDQIGNDRGPINCNMMMFGYYNKYIILPVLNMLQFNVNVFFW